jgi:hypothetical protein
LLSENEGKVFGECGSGLCTGGAQEMQKGSGQWGQGLAVRSQGFVELPLASLCGTAEAAVPTSDVAGKRDRRRCSNSCGAALEGGRGSAAETVARGATSGAKARRSIVAFDAGLNGLLHPLVLSFLFSVFGFQLSVFSFLFSILAFSTVPPRFARRDSRGGCHHIVLPMANRSQKQRRARAPAPHLHGELLAVRHCWFLDRLA